MAMKQMHSYFIIFVILSKFRPRLSIKIFIHIHLAIVFCRTWEKWKTENNSSKWVLFIKSSHRISSQKTYVAFLLLTASQAVS